jgi:uncharacterized delta-60 repeat protein
MKKSIRMIIPCLFIAALLTEVRAAAAAAGSLDTSFGTNGVALTNVGGSLINGMLLDSEGRILLLVSAANAEVLRFTSTGQLDTTFGSSGIAVISPASIALSIALQLNGHILVAGPTTDSSNGQTAMGVVRLNADGSQDLGFGKNGLALADVGPRGFLQGFVVMAETNGDIVVGGQLTPLGRRAPSQTALARFTSSGALDPAFGSQGVSIATGAGGCGALAELSNGGILVVSFESIAQYTSSGSLASSVTGGTVVASNGTTVNNGNTNVFQPNGDYLTALAVFVGEESRGHNASSQVLRFTETGSPDPNVADPDFHFHGSGGPDIEALVNALAVAPNGDIVVAGQQTTFGTNGSTLNGLARLTPGGFLDTSFGSGGTVANASPAGAEGFEAVVVQPNGNIVVGGFMDNNNELFVSRYLGQ